MECTVRCKLSRSGGSIWRSTGPRKPRRAASNRSAAAAMPCALHASAAPPLAV
eukprot:CAMPEP_0175735820 /NCGR_PEP_ID=MMETSP0097-20121207/53099_2 /TAXON_ID=311494 /ORGANISM="Alexandrium monilatum, Strain CCMP3105" /LENGTH=52 /DNA_ID=CAMNT_0017043891 /DNA_START=217 /DNA_END=372 /DNA_ORIENTATION=-